MPFYEIIQYGKPYETPDEVPAINCLLKAPH